MVDKRRTNSLPAGMTGRGLRGRRIARLMFVTAIVPAVLVGALLLMAPPTRGPMHEDDPGPPAAIIFGAAILAYVVGLALMVRIYRKDPEAHRSFWRSRRH